MKDLTIHLIQTKQESDYETKLREKIFIKGQKVPRAREQDGLERQSKRFIVFYKDKPIGCGRVRFINNKAKLERIIIDIPYQGKGFGLILVKHLINYAKKKNPKEIYLHGQLRLKEFYTKCGFKHRKKVFMDGGMKHLEFYIKN